MSDFQFYPTPPNLARRVWLKFKNTRFTRVLEPHAGDGHLALGYPSDWDRHRRLSIDCCEIDITRHATLRDKKLNVVGFDFLQMKSGALYSHILMNPPFLNGAKHVLKAWDVMWDGEIVAIINAETIRNPFSGERQMLVNLIEQYGEVEFVDGAFSVPEADRQTLVDVALVYLRKKANVTVDIIGPVLDDLKADHTDEAQSADYREAAELALPNTLIENSVAAFNAAVRTMKEAVTMEARAR